jgi:hypothetical protein
MNDKAKTALDKPKVLATLKDDMLSADSLRLDTVSKVETWKKEYNGDLYGNEQDKKSKIVSRDIKRQDEWQHASIKDPFLSSPDIIKCKPVTAEDRLAAQQNELILNHQFTRMFDRYTFITNSTKLLTTEGTLIVKCSWDYEDEIVEVQHPKYGLDPMTGQPVQIGVEMVKQINVLVNKPYAEPCRIEDIYIDPTCQGDMNKCQFIIHRYESDLSSLRVSKKYKVGLLDKLAQSMLKTGSDYKPEHEKTGSNFEFKDEARKKILVHEYWGNYDLDGSGIATPMVCTWVNDTMIRLETNPYPDKKIPFLIVAHNSIPFQMTGEANAELIGDNQKISTAIKRGAIDNMASSNNGQKGIRKGALDTVNKKRFLGGKNFEFNGSPADFFEGSYNALPPSMFQMMELNNNETDAMTGIKGFSGGIGGNTLGSTARAAGGVLDAVSVRKLDVVRNISEKLIKPLLRKWMAYNSEFLQEEEIIRITNEEHVPIRRDDLAGQIDIDIEVSTAEDNAAKSQELSFLLQTNGPNEDPGVRQIIMGQIMRLHKMPDVAKKIEEYQPEPDPYVERMKELEMRLKEVEIMERESRAVENQADLRLKTANAVLAEAKAKLTSSTADVKDLEFVNKATGGELNDEMAKKDHDRDTQVALKSFDGLQTN